MSWSIKVAGTPAAVKATANRNADMPQGIKDTIAAICDEPQPSNPPPYLDGIVLEGYGHSGGGSGGIGMLKLERLPLAKET